jgi:hypothetical protein
MLPLTQRVVAPEPGQGVINPEQQLDAGVRS